MSNRGRHTGSRANPDPNTCLGVFGLSLYTTERDLREVFSRYGLLSGVNLVYDQRTGRSRGFTLVYFEIDNSKEAMKEQMGWSWMVEESLWIILSPRELTYLHQAFTWADQLIAEVEVAEEEVVAAAVVAVVDGKILTTIEDMIEAMTDMKLMIAGTEEGRPLLSLFRSRSRSRSYSPRHY